MHSYTIHIIIIGVGDACIKTKKNVFFRIKVYGIMFLILLMLYITFLFIDYNDKNKWRLYL